MHSGDVLNAIERLTERRTGALVLRERCHGIEPLFDRRELRERRAEPITQEPPSHAGPASLHRGDQASGRLARSRGAFEFKASKARGIDGQHGTGLDDRWRPKMLQRLGSLRLVEVAQQRTRCACGRAFRVEAEACERRSAVVRAQCLGRLRAAEVPAGSFRPGSTDGAHHCSLALARGLVVGFLKEQFGHAESQRFVHQARRRHGPQRELAGREFDRGDRRRRTLHAERGHTIAGAVVEQALVHARARRDHAPHITLDQALGFLRILHLLAHRDAEACVDQPTKVGLCAVEWNAGHRDSACALGERDAKRPVRGHRIVVEELVEVAHAKEEQAVGIARLEVRVLPHGGRVAVGRGRLVSHLLHAREGSGSPCRPIAPAVLSQRRGGIDPGILPAPLGW